MATAKQQSETSQPSKEQSIPPAAPEPSAEREAKAKEVSALAREAVTKQKKKALEIKSKSPEATFLPQEFQSFAAESAENFSALMKANEAFLNGVSGIGEQVMTFADARLHQDFEVMEKLMNTTDLGEICRCQSKFAETATRQYLEQANRLFGLMTGTTRQCCAPLEARRDQVVRGLNSR